MTVQVHPIPTPFSVCHLIATSRGMILVDAGGPGAERAVMGRLRRLGRNDLKLIFITHAHLDHYGGADALRRRLGVPLALHRLDSEAMARGDSPVTSGRGLGRPVVAIANRASDGYRGRPTPADRLLADGDTIEGLGVSVSVLHTPGHTDGSSCLIVDGRIALVGDLLSGLIRPRLQHVFAVDWAQLPASLGRLQALRPESVYTGHRRRPWSGAAIRALAPGAPY